MFSFAFVTFTIFQFVYTRSYGFNTAKAGRVPLWNATSTDKLKQDLLLNYDKFARPAQHTNVTTVQFGMEIQHVEVNEFKSTMTLIGYTRMMWTDDKLKWDEEQYGGIGNIKVAPHEIWQPDIVLYNSAITTGVPNQNVNLLVYSNGNVLWVPTSNFPVLCNFNFLHWPLDTQVCSLVVGSWSYHGSHVDLTFYGNDGKSISKDHLLKSPEWNITNISVKRTLTMHECCEENFPTVEVTIYLQRLQSSYKSLIVTPTFVIIVLTLLSFWLPPQYGEKIMLNAITILITFVFMMYFAQKVPVMGSHTPLIVQFYCGSLLVITFALANSVLVIWMSRSRHFIPLPWFIKNLLIGRFGCWLGISNYIKQATINSQRLKVEEMRDHQVTDSDGDSVSRKSFSRCSPSVSYQHDWILLAAAIDRISFVCYSFLFIILASKYSV